MAPKKAASTLAARIGKGLSGSLGGAGLALWGYKAYNKPEGSDWLSNRSFQGQRGLTKEADKENSALTRLASCGVGKADFQQAASAWTGIEFAALRLASMGAEQLKLVVDRWRALGVFDNGERPALTVETRRTYSKNVGATSPTFLGRDVEKLRLSDGDLEGAFEVLEKDGAVFFRNLVDLDGIRYLRKTLKVMGGGSEFGCPCELSGRDIFEAAPGIDRPQEPSTGRRHFLIRGTKLAEEHVQPLLAPVMPLVYRYFAELRPDLFPGKLLEEHGEGGSSPKPSSSSALPRLFLGECQVLYTDPGSVPQIWHRDNRLPGLTMIVPLTDVDDEVGPTELLPGSHRLVVTGRGRSLSETAAAMFRSGGSVAAAPATAGDLLVYDARLLHRGMGNNSYSRCRAVIAIRIDCEDTPPPGETITQTQVARIGGSFMNSVGWIYKLLPVP